MVDQAAGEAAFSITGVEASGVGKCGGKGAMQQPHRPCERESKACRARDRGGKNKQARAWRMRARAQGPLGHSHRMGPLGLMLGMPDALQVGCTVPDQQPGPMSMLLSPC